MAEEGYEKEDMCKMRWVSKVRLGDVSPRQLPALEAEIAANKGWGSPGWERSSRN